MSQALYRKWRPRRWEDVVNQDHIIQTLRHEVSSDRVAHAYLFAGPRGTGKTSTARLLAKAVNCLDPDLGIRPCDKCDHCQALTEGRFLDLIEIDAASNTSVDDVRDLRDKINFSPNQGRYKVYVIDEVHMLSTAAFNALLKTLEEPPSHAIFILATTEAHKIPATVLSRCQRHEFRRIPVKDIVAHLQEIATHEKIQVTADTLELIARQATGSLRDAISLLDLLASLGGDINLDIAQSVLGTATSQAVISVIDALLTGDPSSGLERIHMSLDSGSDPRQFSRQIVDYLRDVLLIRMGSENQVDVILEIKTQMTQQAKNISVPQLLRLLRAFNQAAQDSRGTWQPALPLEIAFVESLEILTGGGTTKGFANTKKSSKGPQNRAVKPSSQGHGSIQPADKADEPVNSEKDQPRTGSDENPALKDMIKNWSQILALVREQNPNTYGLLNSCKSRYLKGNVLTLGFASDVLKNQMSKRENLEIVQGVLSQVLGVDLLVRCVINTAKRNALPPDVDHNGMVATALRDLGGELVDIQ